MIIDVKPEIQKQSSDNRRLMESVRFSDNMQTRQTLETTRVTTVNSNGLSALTSTTYSADLKGLNEQAKKAWQ